jgi:hypothetical protein
MAACEAAIEKTASDVYHANGHARHPGRSRFRSEGTIGCCYRHAKSVERWQFRRRHSKRRPARASLTVGRATRQAQMLTILRNSFNRERRSRRVMPGTLYILPRLRKAMRVGRIAYSDRTLLTSAVIIFQTASAPRHPILQAGLLRRGAAAQPTAAASVCKYALGSETNFNEPGLRETDLSRYFLSCFFGPNQIYREEAGSRQHREPVRARREWFGRRRGGAGA